MTGVKSKHISRCKAAKIKKAVGDPEAEAVVDLEAEAVADPEAETVVDLEAKAVKVPEAEADPEAEEDDKRAKMRKKKEDKESR